MTSPAVRSRPRRDAGLLLFATGLVVGLVSASITERFVVRLADRDLELVRAVRDLALEDFVGRPEPGKLVDDALRGMLGGLDRYSRFYGRAEIAELDRETTGQFRGVGIVFRQPTERGQVLFAFPGSPAARSGIGVGDRLLVVGGRNVSEMEAGELQRTIRTAPGEALQALVERMDGTRREVSIPLEQVLDPTVRHARMLDRERGVGYVSIVSFSHRTPEEFDRAVDELRAQGLQRLVLDLRSNPGGVLDAAVRVANRFLARGAIVRTRTRSETEVKEALPEEARFADLGLVLLVDGGSASASEVLAGALQDHCAAVLVGQPTYGKGTVQTLRRLRGDRGIVKLTTAVYHTPSNRSIERWEGDESGSGITPDLLVEIERPEATAIHAYLESYCPSEADLDLIHAWEQTEGVSLLDPPPTDQQLDAAVALFSGGQHAASPR